MNYTCLLRWYLLLRDKKFAEVIKEVFIRDKIDFEMNCCCFTTSAL